MPYIETIGELAEALADLVGSYGCHSEESQCTDNPRTQCRMCFVDGIAERIRQARDTEEE